MILLFLLALGFITLTFGVKSKLTTSALNTLSCQAVSFSGEVDPLEVSFIFEDLKGQIPPIALKEDYRPVLGITSSDKWIEVDLSDQNLKAWEGGSIFLESAISSGLPWWPTPKGEFNIWIKLRATKMEGGSGKYYYNLPNVPYVMYFQNETVPGKKGYGLHGAYWHNDFGTPRSHGCVNLPTNVAEKLYYWTDPQLTDGKNVVKATDEIKGTKVVIHD